MIKIEFRAFAIMLVGALVYWVFHSLVDFLIFDVKFLDNLLHPTNEELIDRLISMVFILLLSTVMSKYTSRLHESEGRYRQLFDHINDAILVQPVGVVNNPEKFIDANQSAYQKLGYSREELARLSPLALIPAEKSQELSSVMQRLLTHKQVFFETILLNKGGGQIPVEIDARIYDYGRESRILWEAHDIADRKQAEEALHKAYDDLERRVVERTAELAEANLQLSKEIEDRKKAEQVLEESAQQLRILTSRLLDAEERERRRISVELHDELGQALALLKFRVNSLRKNFDQNREVFESDCESMLQYLDVTIENVRRISLDLSPTIVEEFGLAFALEYLFEEFREHYDLRWCSLEMDEIDKFLSQQVQVNIYRIFQEILTNALKHANATRLTAVIRKHEDQVAFKVEDNGKGFDVSGILAGVAMHKGTGIAAMRERVRMMEGSFDIFSREDSGTLITFNIPVNRSTTDDTAL